MQYLAGDPFKLPSSGEYPWIDSDYAFAGWVPNVSGHLSFNLIDPSSKLPTFNYQDRLDVPRQVAVHRVRLAQDYPFPDWLVKRVRKSARQDFIMLAESGRVQTPYFRDATLEEADDKNGVLAGVIAVVPADSDRATAKHIKSTLATAEAIISDAIQQKATSGVVPGRRVTQEVLNILSDARDRMSCLLLRFALYRTGELRIWFDIGEFLGRDTTARPATAEELTAARHLTPQAYYFIKDLLHAHYHHTPNSDQLLPLVETPRPSSELEHQTNETTWRYAPLRGLARVVVELRQGRSADGHQRAKGIIAYAQAFQSVLAHIARPKQIGSPNVKSTGIIPYNFDNLTMSLDAVDASTQSSVSARLQFFAIIVGIILSGLALWSGAVQIQPSLCQALGPDACPKIEPGPVVSLVNWVVANPSVFLIILVTAGVIAFVSFFRGLNALPFVERSIRWLRRLAEAVGVQVSRCTQNSDNLGWLVSLGVLGSLTVSAGTIAVKLAPSKSVPPVSTDSAVKGPWASLYNFVGKRAEQSGLLASSVIAPQLRALLGDDYGPFLRAFSPETTLTRDGDLLILASAATLSGDGAYLIIDPRLLRMEAGVRQSGEFKVHRTQGPSMRRPQRVIQLLGNLGRTDGGPVPVETSTCNFASGGKSGRTVQLSGFLKARDFCEYSVELQKGQVISFDPLRAKGLDVRVVEGKREVPIGTAFTAAQGGRRLIRVVWDGWNPRPREALKPREFYVRLAIH